MRTTPSKPRVPSALGAARWGVALVVLIVLAAVFGLYGRPDFLVQLANQLWTCF